MTVLNEIKDVDIFGQIVQVKGFDDIVKKISAEEALDILGEAYCNTLFKLKNQLECGDYKQALKLVNQELEPEDTD